MLTGNSLDPASVLEGYFRVRATLAIWRQSNAQVRSSEGSFDHLQAGLIPRGHAWRQPSWRIVTPFSRSRPRLSHPEHSQRLHSA
jgi:hypothetical protein